MNFKFTIVSAVCLFFAIGTNAQLKAVIMGSSTAYGVGASSYQNSWAGRTTAELNKNSSDGLDTTIYNIAQPGYTTYQEMPDDFVPPPGRPIPDVDFNVTKALSFNPDLVIVSLPSNDISYGYSKSEMISNLRLMSARFFAAGVRCYITTPQPRNDFTAAERDSLVQMVDSVNQSFGAYAVDFWTPLVTHDGTNGLRPEYANGNIHPNDDGHYQLFQRIMNSYIFVQAGPVALHLTAFTAQLQNGAVLLNWHTEQQGPQTVFELQRSVDGHTFTTFNTQSVPDARSAADYSFTDQTTLSGRTYYRLRITEAGRTTYSGIVQVSPNGPLLSLTSLYVGTGGAELIAKVETSRSQVVNIRIVTNTGSTLLQQKKILTEPSGIITIPVGSLASGQYYFSISAEDGSKVTKAFIK